MRIVNLPRFLISMTIIVFVLSLIMSMIGNTVFSASPIEYDEITVSEGDTLWSIATSFEGNINKNIYEIKKANNLTNSIIYVGQKILIPTTLRKVL